MTAPEKMAAMLSALSILATPPAWAAARACSPAPIEADAQIRGQWPDLPAAIRTALDGRDDVDTCARITVRLDRPTIVVGVHLLDGRSASRAVSRKEDVVPTLVALLMLPEGGATASEPPARGAEASAAAGLTGPAGTGGAPGAAARDTRGMARPAVSRPPKPAADLAASPAAPLATPQDPTPLRFELSLATGGRVGGSHLGVALDALTVLDIGGWLLGFQAAAAVYDEGADGGSAASSLLLGILGGRRFRFAPPSSLSIDLAAGPALALRALGGYRAVRAEAGSSPAIQTPPPVDDGPWVRLVASARVNFRARSVVRPFAGVEGDVALGTWSAAAAGAEPRLPPWAIGIVIGAAVGTP